MNVVQSIPAVWVQSTDPRYNAPRAAGYGQYLTPDQQARVERIRQARLLHDGEHRQYFLGEQRTQFDFPPVRVGDRVVQFYETHNVLGLISRKGADLLFGEEPLLRAEHPQQQASLSALVERCNLHRLLHSAAVDASYEADCLLEACIYEGQVYLRKLPGDEVFPIGSRGPDEQYRRYDRLSLQNIGSDSSPVWLLLETRYLVGRIERELWQLSADGKRQTRLMLKHWPLTEGQPPLADVESTGIATNLITWIPNLLVREDAVNDYDGAVDLQDSLNAKTSQAARVLQKHSDPKMAAPVEMANPNGNLQSGYDVYWYSDPTKIPAYITWNAELANAFADRAFVLNQLLVRTETSPVLLGMKEGAAPDSYRKVRLEAFNSVTKAQRKSAYWKAGIRRALSVAQDLEHTIRGVRYDRGPIAVELRDGIPQDEQDQAERQATLRGAKLISVRRALTEQLSDEAAVEKELAELAAEAKAEMPTSLLGEPPAPAVNDAAEVDPAEEQEDDEA